MRGWQTQNKRQPTAPCLSGKEWQKQCISHLQRIWQPTAPCSQRMQWQTWWYSVSATCRGTADQQLHVQRLEWETQWCSVTATFRGTGDQQIHVHRGGSERLSVVLCQSLPEELTANLSILKEEGVTESVRQPLGGELTASNSKFTEQRVTDASCCARIWLCGKAGTADRRGEGTERVTSSLGGVRQREWGLTAVQRGVGGERAAQTRTAAPVRPAWITD